MSNNRRVFEELQLTGSYVNSSDPTKKYVIDSDGIAPNTTRTYTVPDQDTMLVGDDTTDILTNKTINDATNTVGATHLRTQIVVPLNTASTPSVGQALVYNGTNAAWQTVSGVPGGSNRQFQFNNSSAFGGSANFTLSTGTDRPQLVTPIIQPLNFPAVPSSGVIMFPIQYGTGRTTMAIRGFNDVSYELQPSLCSVDIAYFKPRGNSTTIDLLAFTSAVIGTASTINISSSASGTNTSTPEFGLFRRLRYTTTNPPATNQTVSVRSSLLTYSRASGFFMSVKFAFTATTASSRFFVGMSNGTITVAPNNTFATIATQLIGIGFDFNSNQWQMIVRNSAAIQQVQLDTALQTIRNPNIMYEARIFINPVQNNIVYYSLTYLTGTSAGQVISGSITISTFSTDITTQLSPIIWLNNNNVAASVSFDLGQIYLERPNY